MDGRVAWIVVVISATIVVLVIAAILRSRQSGPGSRREMTPDEWIGLGVVFTGAGVALSISTGPAMFGMAALGMIYMAVGYKKKREGDGAA